MSNYEMLALVISVLAFITSLIAFRMSLKAQRSADVLESELSVIRETFDRIIDWMYKHDG